MGYFNFKWQVYSASATRRTYDRNTDKGEVGGSSPPRPTINPPVFMRPFSLLPFSGISRKAFVNDLSTSGIAICRPRRHRRHHDLTRGFTDCLNFLLTATAPRRSRNGKNINVHSRLDCASPPSKTSVHRFEGVAVIDTCVILDHSSPCQGRVACGHFVGAGLRVGMVRH